MINLIPLISANPVLAALVVVSLLLILLIISIKGNIKLDLANKVFKLGDNEEVKAKRSCMDCISIMMSKRLAHEAEYSKLLNCILREQMCYMEQKNVELEVILGNETKIGVFNEFRRSFKENGFCEMNREEFEKYIIDRIAVLSIMLNSNDNPKVNTIIEEIYINAKQVKNRIEKELELLTLEFNNYIDNLVK